MSGFAFFGEPIVSDEEIASSSGQDYDKIAVVNVLLRQIHLRAQEVFKMGNEDCERIFNNVVKDLEEVLESNFG